MHIVLGHLWLSFFSLCLFGLFFLCGLVGGYGCFWWIRCPLNIHSIPIGQNRAPCPFHPIYNLAVSVIFVRQHWWWQLNVSTKRRYLTTRIHNVTTQKPQSELKCGFTRVLSGTQSTSWRMWSILFRTQNIWLNLKMWFVSDVKGP
jgi:hypothetical protein